MPRPQYFWIVTPNGSVEMRLKVWPVDRERVKFTQRSLQFADPFTVNNRDRNRRFGQHHKCPQPI